MHHHLDFETRSSVDLKKRGVYAYAASPDATVLCAAVARGDEPVRKWSPYAKGQCNIHYGIGLFKEISEGDGEVWAHNAGFEFVIWNRVLAPLFGLKPLDPRRMRCTASLARRAVIPHALGQCAAYLGLKNQKGKEGAALIRKFCIPEFAVPEEHPEEFMRFIDYCAQDVESEREVHRVLKAFDRRINQSIFHFNMVVNEVGFPVNVPALTAAQEIILEDREKLTAQFRDITGLNPTQTEKVFNWFQDHGFTGENLRKLTVDEEITNAELNGLPDETVQALRLRQLMSLAALKKVPMMIELADDDGHVRGTLMDHGASTGRSSSKLVQQQNLKRSTKGSEMFYRSFAAAPGKWSADAIDGVYGDVAEVFSQSIRHFIHKPGEALVSVDYAAIECRVVNWLAGQEDALREFREGMDRYILMASRIYDVPVKRISKEGIERFLGKQAVLGCGYQMGASKFQGTCAGYGVEITIDLAELAVKSFRTTHNKVVSFWYDIERAVKRAILKPETVHCRRVVVFCRVVAGRKFLFIQLPSGRLLSYPEPKVTDDRITFHGELTVRDKAQFKAKYKTDKAPAWGRCETYGGKLVENITQAVSADIMIYGGLIAIENGHEVCMMVHDEAVKLTRGEDPRLEDFIRCLTTLPPWADGLPLVAEGKVIPFYSK